MSKGKGAKDLDKFLSSWPTSQEELREAFAAIKTHAESMPDVVWEFVARPGVSNSLRLDLAQKDAGRQRPLFAMIDAVPMDGEFMLSVCFYADEVDDPDQSGDLIPGGLMGADGYCFDHDGQDPSMTDYLKRRISTAHRRAKAA